MQYETLILIFVRAHREKNFHWYVNVLEELALLLFALDHVNYARWLPVHIRDMKSLPRSIKEEFEIQGNWVISKTADTFSGIPFDQAHEQENRNVKGSGGVLVLQKTLLPSDRRWMLSGPELSRLRKQFESEYFSDNDPYNPQNFLNHEQGLSTQKTFQRQVTSLSSIIRKMGNPFLADFSDLVSLDSRDCADESVIAALYTLEDTARGQYSNFVKEVLEERKRSIHEPIKLNKPALFRKPSTKIKWKQGKKIKALENNVSLFGQLYISMQSRELMKCLEPLHESTPPETFSCKVLDGAVIVHCLSIAGITTFKEYSENAFIPHL